MTFKTRRRDRQIHAPESTRTAQVAPRFALRVDRTAARRSSAAMRLRGAALRLRYLTARAHRYNQHLATPGAKIDPTTGVKTGGKDRSTGSSGQSSPQPIHSAGRTRARAP